MRTGRSMLALSVTENQRSALENWARWPKAAQALALRARIILACARKAERRCSPADARSTTDGEQMAVRTCREPRECGYARNLAV